MTAAATGGRELVRALVQGGVRHAFTVPGESFLGVLDALHDAPIRILATRHEGGAVFMAEGYGQLTGLPAVCLATRAVGAANLAIGLHTATANSTPLLAIVGQVPRAFRGRESFQEVDQVATFGRLCKGAVQVDEPGRLAAETARLLAVSRSGRPGPVLLAVPEDVLEAELPASTQDAAPPEAAALAPDPETVRLILGELAAASAPLIVAGAGVLRSRATGALVAFAERFAVPVMASWRRPDVMPNEHPFYIGMTGLASPPTVRKRFAEADLVVALGTRLNQMTSFGYALPAAGTRLIQVDASPGFAGDRRQPDVVVTAHARRFLEAALALPEVALPEAALPEAALPDGPAQARRRAGIAVDRAAYLAATTLRARPAGTEDGLVDPAVAVRALAAALPRDAVVTTDAGNFAGWYARGLRFEAGQRFLGPTSGAMGYALPAAVGASVAEPGRPVVALAGDGGFAMLMAELETAVRAEAHVTAIVHDNQRYGTIRMDQERVFPGRVVATELGPLDFAAVARACGARAWRVERDADVAPALEAALADPGVTLVHLRTDPRRLSVDRDLA